MGNQCKSIRTGVIEACFLMPVRRRAAAKKTGRQTVSRVQDRCFFILFLLQPDDVWGIGSDVWALQWGPDFPWTSHQPRPSQRGGLDTAGWDEDLFCFLLLLYQWTAKWYYQTSFVSSYYCLLSTPSVMEAPQVTQDSLTVVCDFHRFRLVCKSVFKISNHHLQFRVGWSPVCHRVRDRVDPGLVSLRVDTDWTDKMMNKQKNMNIKQSVT